MLMWAKDAEMNLVSLAHDYPALPYLAVMPFCLAQKPGALYLCKSDLERVATESSRCIFVDKQKEKLRSMR